MDITSLSPITNIPKPTEASSLRSPRDKDSIYKLWKFIHTSIERCNQLSEIVKQQNRDIKRLQDRRVLDFEFFPFKIYNVPTDFRPQGNTLQYTGSANWRTFRVRGGLVLNQVVSTGSYVNGTDGMQNYSYYNLYPNPVPQVGPSDIQVPLNTSQYWFWIEQSGSFRGVTSPYYLRYGSNPASSSLPGNPNPWATFPTASVSGSQIAIGYVDTLSSGSNNQAFVRQFLTSDITTIGGGSGTNSDYKGLYDQSASYNPFDEIRVLQGYDYGTPNIVPGVYINVYSVPGIPSGSQYTGSNTGSRIPGVNYYPQWPEPCNLPTTASAHGRYWELVSLMPQKFSSCGQDGSLIEYWVAGQLPAGSYVLSSSVSLQCSSSL